MTALQDFFEGKQSLPFPFSLELECESKKQLWQCHQVLRLLPAKRLVVDANNKLKQHAVIKIFAANKKGERDYQRELVGYKLAQAAEINVPKLLVSSSSSQPKPWFAIAYEFIANSETLHSVKVTKNEQLVAKVIKMLIKMHENGIFQQDLHLDNLLLKEDKLYLLDLGSVKSEQLGKPLSRSKSLDNLALLMAQFYPKQQAHVCAWLPHYYQQRGWQWNQLQQTDFLNRFQRIWRKRQQDWLQKGLRTCSATQFYQDWTLRYAFQRESLPIEPAQFVNEIEQYMSQGEAIKLGNSATVVKVNIADQIWVIKRYNIKNKWHAVRRCLRDTRAVTSWQNARLLNMMGIKTLKPIGFVEQRFGPLRGCAYFISAYQQSEELLSVYQRRAPTEDELMQLQAIFTDMQRCLISHGDLKAQNLLLDDQGNIRLIDLDVMQFHQDQQRFKQRFNKDMRRFVYNWQNNQSYSQFKQLIALIQTQPIGLNGITVDTKVSQ